MEIKVRVSSLFWDDFVVSGHFKAAQEIGNGLAYHIPNIIRLKALFPEQDILP